MTTNASRIDLIPSAIPPTEAELEAWTALSREAQLSRYREALAHPDCSTVSGDSMNDILAAARARVAARELGCDEDEPRFEEKLKKVVRHKPSESFSGPKDMREGETIVDELSESKAGHLDPDAGLRPRSLQSKRGAKRVDRRPSRK
jgi:hypothetical protein